MICKQVRGVLTALPRYTIRLYYNKGNIRSIPFLFLQLKTFIVIRALKIVVIYALIRLLCNLNYFYLDAANKSCYTRAILFSDGEKIRRRIANPYARYNH